MDSIEGKKAPEVSNQAIAPDAKTDEAEVEQGQVIMDAEPQKTYYSKTSVWLMILFSGLAIGSDG
jgi:hypothetical protein